MVPPCSDRMARVPPYSRTQGRVFPYGAVTRSGPPFQTLPVTLPQATGLVRFRSPLLAESLLMSFPPATEMFQFARFASPALWIEAGNTACAVGFPIRKSADQSFFAAPRGLSQRSTSFIASQRQGIRQTPLRHLIALINNAHSHSACDPNGSSHQHLR